MTGIKTGLLAKLLLRPKVVIQAFFSAAVGDEAPAIAVFIIHHHPWRPLVVAFHTVVVIRINFWRGWPAGWRRRRHARRFRTRRWRWYDIISWRDIQTAFLGMVVGKTSNVTSQLAILIVDPTRSLIVTTILDLMPAVARESSS